MSAALAEVLAAELDRPIPAGTRPMVDALAAKGGGTVAAVLFYGSILRTGDLDGILDFYVLVDSLRAWHGSPGLALATRLLPPTVEYWEVPVDGRILRAKVAVMRPDQFARAVRPGSLDTTIWARFAQPARLAYARDAAARNKAAGLVATATTTACAWAARLGPDQGTPLDYWDALFRHTYAAELRVETGERAVSIVGHDPARYRDLFRPALAQAGLDWREVGGGALAPALTPAQRKAARRGWALRRLAGKALNVSRLAKAAFTFVGGVDYITWKIERHSGVRLEMTPWQRRHPILSAPLLLWQLRRQGAIR
ncbi:hypothetical protein HHL28_04590 [Aerophototrophica crusticola]|uniref:Uncharacterized protein n=1 Tax=Aerophototrophica crusticola TaxID=1709002 RepID=A0A858R510_9PROT|nr:hypothetical protein HHL28_04590 [Rhodospirillaceae bacterium B3]